VATLQAGKGVDATRVIKARDEMQTAAADLSTALLSQIDVALSDRLSSLTQRRLLAIGVLVVAVLLAFAPIGLDLLARRRRSGKAAPPKAPAHQAPAHPAPEPPAPVTVPPQWPDPGPYHTPNSEYAQWERFGASQ
jgi:hypothetical protein